MDFSKLDLINKLLSDAQEHMAEQYDEENIRLNDIIINLCFINVTAVLC